MKQLAHNLFKAYLRLCPIAKGKERLMNRFWRPLAFGEYLRLGRLKHTPIELECDLTQWIQRHIYFLGEYEPESCQLWARLARDAGTIFDVGANIGIYSLIAATMNQTARIHAFEPTPELFDALVRNLNRNSLVNVTARREAVGATAGSAFLRRFVGSNEGMNYVTEAREWESQVVVARLCLDDYCQAAGIDRVNLMKIDIEGGEYDALRGAEKMLARKAIDCIFIELLEPTAARGGHSAGEIMEFLERAGYHWFEPVHGRLRALQGRNRFGDNAVAFALPPDSRELVT